MKKGELTGTPTDQTKQPTSCQQHRFITLPNKRLSIMTPRKTSGSTKQRGRKRTGSESTEKSVWTEEKKYTAENVMGAIDTVCEYLKEKSGKNCCVNINNKPTGTCDCAFQILEMKKQRDRDNRPFQSMYTMGHPETVPCEEMLSSKIS